VVIHREGAERTISVRPADAPATLGLRILQEIAGLSVADERRAVVIDDVARGSRSAEIGLTAGDLIVGVNGTEVRSVRELNDEVMKGTERSSIVLSVQRGRYIYNLTFPMGT
jgi:serine protease Do/serine protease DegQ